VYVVSIVNQVLSLARLVQLFIIIDGATKCCQVQKNLRNLLCPSLHTGIISSFDNDICASFIIMVLIILIIIIIIIITLIITRMRMKMRMAVETTTMTLTTTMTAMTAIRGIRAIGATLRMIVVEDG
jgi:hypothetical protein